MPERRYVLDRGYPFIDPISAEHARRIWERVLADPEAELKGTFEEGFTYLVGDRGELRLLRAGVWPVTGEGPGGEFPERDG